MKTLLWIIIGFFIISSDIVNNITEFNAEIIIVSAFLILISAIIKNVQSIFLQFFITNASRIKEGITKNIHEKTQTPKNNLLYLQDLIQMAICESFLISDCSFTLLDLRYNLYTSRKQIFEQRLSQSSL